MTTVDGEKREFAMNRSASRLAKNCAFALIVFAQSSCALSDAATPEIKDCAECPPMVRIAAMNRGNDLYVARHELTWKEYLPSVAAAGCPLPWIRKELSYPSDLSKLADEYPITMISPNAFDCYVDWIRRKTGFHYRLPTAAEWEYAARAGVSTRFPWGDAPQFDQTAINTWFDPKRLKASAPDVRDSLGKDTSFFRVEAFHPNRWGLYDVIGNVAELTSETKPGTQNCIAISGSARCTLIAARGGQFESISLQMVGGVVSGPVGRGDNYFVVRSWHAADFQAKVGLRLVREAGQ